MSKQLNLRTKDGYSWEDVYDIDAGDLTNADRDNFFVHMITGAGHDHVEAVYTGSGALTTSEFNNFEVGSTILCPGLSIPGIYLKTAATTWKFQAINT